MTKKDTSSESSSDDDDTDDNDENIERMAHVLSDTEDNSINKAEVKKELEKLTEVELQRKYKQLSKELTGCRRRVRDRLERKLKDVKSSDMVGLLRRLKTKLNILEDVKKKRIATLYKRQGELRKKIAEKKLRETLERGDAKKKKEEKKKDRTAPGQSPTLRWPECGYQGHATETKKTVKEEPTSNS